MKLLRFPFPASALPVCLVIASPTLAHDEEQIDEQSGGPSGGSGEAMEPLMGYHDYEEGAPERPQPGHVYRATNVPPPAVANDAEDLPTPEAREVGWHNSRVVGNDGQRMIYEVEVKGELSLAVTELSGASVFVRAAFGALFFFRMRSAGRDIHPEDTHLTVERPDELSSGTVIEALSGVPGEALQAALADIVSSSAVPEGLRGRGIDPEPQRAPGGARPRRLAQRRRQQ